MAGRVLVTGAAGFVGRHMVARLKDDGHVVRGVDREEPSGATSRADEFLRTDLRERQACDRAVDGVDRVYHLAAVTARTGPFPTTHASVCRDNTAMNLQMLEAAAEGGVERFLFASSTAVYPAPPADAAESPLLSEEDAWPADPEPGHGEEKLYAERLCAHYREDLGLDTRVARLQRVYGPGGPYEGGRETAPATLCREVAVTADGGTITLWGDGRETGSCLYVADCVEGLRRLMRSGCHGPLNLGTDRVTSINELVERVVAAAGKEIHVEHDPGKPGGRPGRRLDLTRLRRTLDWTPPTGLADGLAETYPWIEERMRDTAAARRHPGPPHLP